MRDQPVHPGYTRCELCNAVCVWGTEKSRKGHYEAFCEACDKHYEWLTIHNEIKANYNYTDSYLNYYRDLLRMVVSECPPTRG